MVRLGGPLSTPCMLVWVILVSLITFACEDPAPLAVSSSTATSGPVGAGSDVSPVPPAIVVSTPTASTIAHSNIATGSGGASLTRTVPVLSLSLTVTPTATQVPSPTATAVPRATSTAVPIPTATVAPIDKVTAIPPATATAVPTEAPTIVPSATATAVVPTATAEPAPTPTQPPPPTATATPVPPMPGEQLSDFHITLERGIRPAIADEVLYIGGAWSSGFFAVDARTLERVWHYPVEGGVRRAAIFVDDLVIFGTNQGDTVALSRTIGRERWVSASSSPIEGELSSDGEHVFVAYTDGHVAALSLEDGSKVWDVKVGHPVRGGTVYDAGTVYLASDVGEVHALDARTGEEVWRAVVDGGRPTLPTVGDGMVVVGTEWSGVHALSADTGVAEWTYGLRDPVWKPPAFDGGSLYFGDTAGSVYSLTSSEGLLNWRFKTGGPIESTPLVSEGVVYVGSNDDYAYALDAETGTLGWRFRTHQDVASSAAIGDGVLYIPSMDSRVYALVPGISGDAQASVEISCGPAVAGSDSLVWTAWTLQEDQDADPEPGTVLSTLTPTLGSSPWSVSLDGVVLQSTGAGSVQAVDPSSGDLEWEYTAGSDIHVQPTLIADRLVFAEKEGCVHALELETGSPLWDVGFISPVVQQLATDGSTVYAVFETGEMRALNPGDGSVRWTVELLGWPTGGLAEPHGVIYVASSDGLLSAHDAESGEHLWTSDTLRSSHSTPLIAEDLVLVGSPDERVYAFDSRTGRPVWNFWTGGEVRGSVVAADGSAFFASDDGYLYAVGLQTGKIVWRTEIGNPGSRSPVASDGLVYVVSDDVWLSAVDPSNGEVVWRYESPDELIGSPVLRGSIVNLFTTAGAVVRLAGGFPEAYVSGPLPPSTSEYVPLTPKELREAIAFLTADGHRQVRVEAVVYGSDGKRDTIVDHSKPVLDVFGTGYYLLTGRTYMEDGWELRYLTRTEFVEEYGSRSHWFFGAGAWCCERTDEGLRLLIRGEFGLQWSVQATTHEAGHALAERLNPAQMKARGQYGGPLVEAQAGAFEGALGRMIGEYTDLETAEFSDARDAAREIDGLRQRMKESLEDDPEGPHDRSSLIIWHAVFNDPDLAHLKEELLEEGRLSSKSYLDLFYRLVMIPPGEVGSYVESIVPESVSDQMNIMSAILSKRTGHRPHPDYLGISRYTVLLP